MGFVNATFAIGSNMRGLKCRQPPLSGYRAAPPVDVGHDNAERTLTEPGPDASGFAVTRLFLGHSRNTR